MTVVVVGGVVLGGGGFSNWLKGVLLSLNCNRLWSSCWSPWLSCNCCRSSAWRFWNSLVFSGCRCHSIFSSCNWSCSTCVWTCSSCCCSCSGKSSSLRTSGACFMLWQNYKLHHAHLWSQQHDAYFGYLALQGPISCGTSLPKFALHGAISGILPT